MGTDDEVRVVSSLEEIYDAASLETHTRARYAKVRDAFVKA